MPRIRVFARKGVAHAWLADPAARTLEVYELSAGLWTLLAAHEADELVRAVPFGEFELVLADLMGRLQATVHAPRLPRRRARNPACSKCWSAESAS